MHAVIDVDTTTVRIDPMREAAPLAKPLPYPGRVRGGPDWLAFIGNWMTEWERTGNTKWRDKIVTGMESIAGMPYGFMTGPQNLYGYDPATGKLSPLEEDGFGTYNLTVNMGGPEVVFELNELIENPAWHKTWLQYCRLHNAGKEVVKRDMATGSEGADARYSPPGRLAAYVYAKTKNEAFAGKAKAGIRLARYASPAHLAGPEVLNPIDELTGVSTNNTAQGCLEAIEILEMVKA
jgi:PcRGLX-like protein C-terminal alpha/alpha toroid domain